MKIIKQNILSTYTLNVLVLRSSQVVFIGQCPRVSRIGTVNVRIQLTRNVVASILQGKDVCPLGAGCVSLRGWMCVLQGAGCVSFRGWICVLQGLDVCPSEAGCLSFRGWMCVLQGLDMCPSGAGCVFFRGWICVLQGLDVCPSGAGCVSFRGWVCVL